ncbi:MAG: TIGR03619 family F420-dependent LLM class oxidoreductase [Pseudomonadota bacterium]
MDIGVTLRNMGEQSTPQIMSACAAQAEAAGVESIWITDHIAIPPDDAEGSGGRYLDTLTGLAWLAGQTTRIKLGSGVLILPYRAMLPTAKQIATIQELSAERLLLGVGVGWMDAEFKALGIDRHQRGAQTDATLAFLNTCFANDEVTHNGQTFLFRPRPAPPPILVGGRAPFALRRAVAYGDGWLPMARNAAQIADDFATYQTLCAEAGKGAAVTVMSGLPLDEPGQALDMAAAYETLGVDRLVCAIRYDTVAQYTAQVGLLMEVAAQLSS